MLVTADWVSVCGHGVPAACSDTARCRCGVCPFLFGDGGGRATLSLGRLWHGRVPLWRAPSAVWVAGMLRRPRAWRRPLLANSLHGLLSALLPASMSYSMCNRCLPQYVSDSARWAWGGAGSGSGVGREAYGRGRRERRRTTPHQPRGARGGRAACREARSVLPGAAGACALRCGGGGGACFGA